jgi:hypothetical protein
VPALAYINWRSALLACTIAVWSWDCVTTPSVVEVPSTMPAAIRRGAVVTAFEGFATGVVTTAGNSSRQKSGLRKSNGEGRGRYYLVLMSQASHRQSGKDNTDKRLHIGSIITFLLCPRVAPLWGQEAATRARR